MSLKHISFSAIVSALSLALATSTAQASVWKANDLFTSSTDSNLISRYSATGSFLGSFTIGGTGSDVRGMAFDGKGSMYAVRTVGSGLGVTVVDKNGVVRNQYSAASYVMGNLSYGAIAVAKDGTFFVASQGSLIAFTPGVAQGKSIYSQNQVHDVEVLPNGNLLVLSAYALDEITPTGALVRHVKTPYLVDARGLEYDAARNDIYVSMLGYTNNYFQLMRLDGTTGALEKRTSFWYGNDLLLTSNGRLLAGSRTLAPRFFSPDLTGGASLGNRDQLFVAQYAPAAVPEPGSALLMIAGVAAFTRVRRRQRGA